MLLRTYRKLRALLRLPAQLQAERAEMLKAIAEGHDRAEGQLFKHATLISDQLNLALRDLSLLTQRQIEYQRETRLLLGQMSLPPNETWLDRLRPEDGKPADAMIFPKSTICRQDSLESPYFAYWTSQLHMRLRYHRKLWEFVFICQALTERGYLQPGKRGLGFGVGEEPLAAYFASKGCRITGTDMAPEAAAQSGWVETAQHASGKEALRMPYLCPDPVFDANVEFRFADMNHVPDDMTGYDFCWSACALEHLGSIDSGLDFIERSLECLKPGGLAVHTTEFNLFSDDETVDNASTVLFRQRDFQALAARLTAAGHIVAPFDFELGYGAVDRYIDVAPYRQEPHLSLALQGFATTSIGMIVQKR